MIDHSTYRKMHEDGATLRFDRPGRVYSFDTMPVYINPDDSPAQTLLALLPPTIHGFDLSEKRWIHLRVDSINPVSWNRKAYERLAIPDQSKDVLRTLVLAQKSQSSIDLGSGAARTRTDIVAGKGNGLTVLLRGGPGTGKTLTAESMAEIAAMPLYRVACGNVRTDADAANSDLALALHLGKAWNCILLFEEAQIPQRAPHFFSTTDFLSSFLHMLEYYNGIVVLTASCNLSLDRAVTSRIQLVLQLEDLNTSSRKTIWQNFIDLLEEDRGDANFEDLRLHLEDLSRKELNGHQIRNVFKTGKELAMSRYQRLEWRHLEQALSLLPDFTPTYVMPRMIQ
jgi:hypothetical protein